MRFSQGPGQAWHLGPCAKVPSLGWVLAGRGWGRQSLLGDDHRQAGGTLGKARPCWHPGAQSHVSRHVGTQD